MTARKKTPAPKPVTVAEMLLALASYPQDATLELSDPYTALVVSTGSGDDDVQILWEPLDTTTIVSARPLHYRRPEVEPTIVTRPADGRDEFVTVKDFLEWLQTTSYTEPQEAWGGGHNEPTSYRTPPASRLAEEYATRSIQ